MATSPDPSNHWRYPGPSTRYHRSEVTRPAHHARFKSEYKVQGPVLSTELRAHRRAQSSTIFPPSTPTAWRGGRPMSSSSSSIPSPSPTTKMSAITPEKPRRRSSDLRDSPFSDSCYFTEDDRSDMAASSHVPGIPSGTQSLIIRLSKLQAQLLREDPPHLSEIVERKLNEIEAEIFSRRGSKGSLQDSGLFMNDEDVAEVSTPQQPPVTTAVPDSLVISPVIEVQETLSDAEGIETVSDISLREAHEVLESVTKVQTELRQQLEELRALRAEMDLPEDDEVSLKAAMQLGCEPSQESQSKMYLGLDVQTDKDDDIIPFPPFEDITIIDTDLNDEPNADIKSAWRELWAGLTAFAGMGHDEDLDSDIDISA